MDIEFLQFLSKLDKLRDKYPERFKMKTNTVEDSTNNKYKRDLAKQQRTRRGIQGKKAMGSG